MDTFSSDIDVAWAAGLFEGEGSIFIATVKSRGAVYVYPRLELKMTDEDVVKRFADILNCGKVHYKPAQRATYKDAWCWQLTDFDDCTDVISLFWPFLGDRRKAKAKEIGLA